MLRVTTQACAATLEVWVLKENQRKKVREAVLKDDQAAQKSMGRRGAEKTNKLFENRRIMREWRDEDRSRREEADRAREANEDILDPDGEPQERDGYE